MPQANKPPKSEVLGVKIKNIEINSVIHTPILPNGSIPNSRKNIDQFVANYKFKIECLH